MMQDLYKIFSWRLLAVFLLIGLTVLSFWPLLLAETIEKAKPLPVKIASGPTALPDLFQGALFLQPKQISFSLKELQRGLKVSVVEARPGQKQKEPKIEVSLNQQSRQVLLEEKVFLAYDGGFVFCEKSPFFLTFARSKKPKHIDVRAGIEKEDSVVYQMFDIALSSKTNPSGYVFGLDLARYLGPDLFAQQKKTKDLLIQRPRLLIGKTMLYLAEGDFYVLDQKWQKTDLQKEEDRPVFKVAELLENKLKLEVWEKDLKRELIFTKTAGQDGPGHDRSGHDSSGDAGLEKMFENASLRTQKQIALKLDKQRLILRKGDLFFKKENRWQQMLSPTVDLALLEKLQGTEFFVFQELEEGILKIYFFNKERSEMQAYQKNLSKKHIAKRK